MVTVRPMSGTMPRAETSRVPGMACCRPSAPWYSLLRLSLPEIKGAQKATAASWQPRAQRTSPASRSGLAGLPQQKLSSRETWSGSAPTATQLRMASSTAAQAIL